jgi:hypothetical protein
MYTTSKKSKMISQLELDSSSQAEPARVRDVQSVEGRVVVLCLTTWYFGYVFCEMSPLGPAVLKPVFGDFMSKEEGVGPCFGLIPLGAAAGVIMANLLIDHISRKYLHPHPGTTSSSSTSSTSSSPARCRSATSTPSTSSACCRDSSWATS